MSRALFGTDGVRGLAGKYPLDETGTVKIGRAVGNLFGQPGQEIVLAWDPRESSKDLIDYLTRGLNEVGITVTLVGVLPTPGLAFITREKPEFVAGIMVTASHNPAQYNGIKVFDSNGDKLSDETETTLNKLIEDGVDDQIPGSINNNDNLIDEYVDFLVESAGDFKLTGLKIVIDCANGASSGISQKVFERLDAKATVVFDKPDGLNINDGCGATHTEAVSKTVVDGGYDLGVAFDGDADRVMLVDQQGRILDGDHIIYILAVSGGLDGVVATVMTNLGTENSLHEKGIKIDRVAVGDRYVLEGLTKTGYKVGGEQAGHIILKDLLATGDGMLAAVQTVKAVAVSGKSLAAWRDEVKLLPQALVNVSLQDKTLLDNPQVKQLLAKKTDELADKGRVLIRPSGTEPLVRVMVEAPEAEQQAQQIADELKRLLESLK